MGALISSVREPALSAAFETSVDPVVTRAPNWNRGANCGRTNPSGRSQYLGQAFIIGIKKPDWWKILRDFDVERRRASRGVSLWTPTVVFAHLSGSCTETRLFDDISM